MGVPMSAFVRVLRFLSLFLVVSCPALAFAQDWIVSRTTKQVSYTVDKTAWHAVEVGSSVPNKAWVSTGPRGRVTLARGEERITLSPNTLGAVITTQGLFSRKTEVVQQIGQIALEIEKRSRPHTYVHTPFMAAVVKGTTFTVTVTEDDASLSVEEGLVQVSSFTGAQSTHVGPGQQVTVDQNQTMSVAGVSAAPSVESVAPSAASIAAVGQASPIGADAADASQSGHSSVGGANTGSNSNSSGDSGSGNGGGWGTDRGTGSSADDRNDGGNGNGPGESDSGKGEGKGPGKGESKGSGKGEGKGPGGAEKDKGGNSNGGKSDDRGNGKGNNGKGKGNGGPAGGDQDQGKGNGKGNNGNGHGNGGPNGKGNNGKGHGDDD